MEKENKELIGTYELPKREIKFRYFNHGKMEYYSYEDNSMWALHEVSNPDKLMQYTGRKDKNGFDVYEGDIVKFYSPILEKYLIEYVYFSKRCGLYLGDIFINDVSEIEIIGNIFENPELLEA